MTDATRLLALAVSVVVVNVPFGYWRAGTRKFTWGWLVAVHAPVPVVVALRVTAGVALRLSVAPLLVGAYFGGQVVGGALRRRQARRRRP